jgi:hypothetical protein
LLALKPQIAKEREWKKSQIVLLLCIYRTKTANKQH